MTVVFIAAAETSTRELVKAYDGLCRSIGKTCGVYKKIDGVPVISDGYISIAHSGEFKLAAFSEKPVGVDLEKRRRIRADKIARRFFDEKSNETLTLGADFFDLWTRKEACAKRSGIPLLSALKRDADAVNFDFIEGYSVAVSGGEGNIYFINR